MSAPDEFVPCSRMRPMEAAPTVRRSWRSRLWWWLRYRTPFVWWIAFRSRRRLRAQGWTPEPMQRRPAQILFWGWKVGAAEDRKP